MTRTVLVVGLLAGALVGVGATLVFLGPAPPDATAATPTDDDLSGLAQFESRAAFEAYVERGRERDVRYVSAAGGDDGARRQTAVRRETAADAPPATSAPQATPAPQTAPKDDEPSRVGETNVQVAALDEPDRVKTDGTAFYYAPGRAVRVHEPRSEDARPHDEPGGTHVLDASDPADPRAIAAIDATGQLLRTGDRLLVLERDELVAYNVSDPADPAEVWSRPLADDLVTARERDGTVYLVTRTPVHDSPCPIAPVGADAAVPCTEVYRPGTQITVDATYTAIALDASDGDVVDTVSFVGTGRNTVVYMSTDALYVTYTKTTSRATVMADFLTEAFDRTPPDVVARVEEVQSYDISPESTRREITRAVRSWLERLEDDERHEVTQALEAGFSTYRADRQRDLVRTGLVRVDVAGTDLRVDETATVPGRPLNQFSLDQHEGTLRVATTIPGAGAAESVSDLYTLDAATLERRGQETDMGEGQRVYAVRYVGETAYVVTFRQVDPLHVVDLSNPADPTEVGTLELPGFSNYLHPIDDEHVLGIGEEDGQVKATLFDVGDPTDPQVADSTLLEASWSAVSRTHHAFTIDRKHGVVFLPAGGEGRLVDYTNGSLATEHVVRTDGPAERARYVGDYLYVFAGSEVAVVDETDWSRTATVSLDPA